MLLAQLNVGRLLYPQDDPRVAEFMFNLDLVNGIAERSLGFVWRYMDESCTATDTRAIADDPDMILNLTVWTDAARWSSSSIVRCTSASTPNAIPGSIPPSRHAS